MPKDLCHFNRVVCRVILACFYYELGQSQSLSEKTKRDINITWEVGLGKLGRRFTLMYQDSFVRFGCWTQWVKITHFGDMRHLVAISCKISWMWDVTLWNQNTLGVKIPGWKSHWLGWPQRYGKATAPFPATATVMFCRKWGSFRLLLFSNPNFLKHVSHTPTRPLSSAKLKKIGFL